MPKTVLLCRVDGNFGGVEKTILSIARHLDPTRYTPVVVPIGTQGELARQAKASGISVAPLPMPSRLAVWPAQAALGQIAGRHEAALIHTFGIRSNTLALLTTRRLGLPWIIRVPNINCTDYTNPLHGWLAHAFNNALLRRASAVQVISPQLVQYLSQLRKPPRRIDFIPNGVDVSQFSPDDDQTTTDTVVIGSTGRLEPIKGYDLLIEAFATIHAHYPSAQLVLVGNGSQEAVLRDLARQLQIETHVHFSGYMADVCPALAQFTLFVCSSHSEGVPNALLEAMAMGLPIISTQVGGISSILSEREAVLIPPGDPRALADAMLCLLGESERRWRLGQAARARAEAEFSVQSMVNRVMQMYDEVIQNS
ncbi:MAG: glycosyltransferase [bacterium]|jgi:glycosyltransferase involved in cell wall biosynthesis|nr:glycosyltransferase [bacterium]